MSEAIDPRRKVYSGDEASSERRVWRAGKPARAAGPASREVVVRVTGRTKDAKALGAQLSYLTRKGELPGLHSSGDILHGIKAMRALRDRWTADNAAYAEHPSCTTQSVGIVLSMPAGTPLADVVASVKHWADRHIAPTTQYFIAPHTDRAHPHCHVAVRSVQIDGHRVRATKEELESWRKTFAQELRSRGISAEATPQRLKVERLLAEIAERERRREPLKLEL